MFRNRSSLSSSARPASTRSVMSVSWQMNWVARPATSVSRVATFRRIHTVRPLLWT
jgi:hypothetical protein